MQNDGGRMAESQLSDLRDMQVLIDEARLLARDLVYHWRAALETSLGRTLEEIERQTEYLRRGERG